jgi:serine/threonine protein kinase
MGQCVSAPAEAPISIIQDRHCEDDYEFNTKEDKIGEGVQGVVFAAKNRVTGASVALKRTHIGRFGSSAARASAFSEIELLSYVDHPNVVKLLGAYQTPHDIYTVLTRVEGCHLIKYLVEVEKEENAGLSHDKIVTEKMALLRQLTDAVAHVHSRGVVYRDLKPANVMISTAKPRKLTLIDFGRATHLDREDRIANQPPLGTSLFQAPEVESRGSYGQQSDMWSVGVIIYLLISGRMPFEHSVAGLYKVLAGAYEPFDETFSPHARSLVSKLLLVDPDKRLNAAQCVQHPFFTDKGLSAARSIMAKLPKSVYSSEGCIAALELHKEIVSRTTDLMASKLREEDIETIQRWLAMSVEEESINACRRGPIGAFPLTPSGRNTSDMALKALEEANTRVRKSLDGDDRTIGEESVKRKQSLNVLYMEMRAVGEASVRHRGGARFVDATPRLAASGNGQGSKPPRAPNTDSGAPETLDTPPVMKAAIARSNSKSRLSSMAMYDTADSSVKGSRFDTVDSSVGGGSANGEGSNRGNSTFMNVAHVHGLCSLDELIQACRSSGCEAMAGDLEGVKDQLREERVKDLVDSGLKTTNASNALLDTMLFRFHDLFQKVITSKAEHARQAKEEAARGTSFGDEGGPTTTEA